MFAGFAVSNILLLSQSDYCPCIIVIIIECFRNITMPHSLSWLSVNSSVPKMATQFLVFAIHCLLVDSSMYYKGLVVNYCIRTIMNLEDYMQVSLFTKTVIRV